MPRACEGTGCERAGFVWGVFFIQADPVVSPARPILIAASQARSCSRGRLAVCFDLGS